MKSRFRDRHQYNMNRPEFIWEFKKFYFNGELFSLWQILRGEHKNLPF